DPHQVPDFIALRGDPSDKLPGVAGLGAAGGAQGLRTYGTLENGLKAGGLFSPAEKFWPFCSISTTERTTPLPPPRRGAPSRRGGQEQPGRKAGALPRDGELKQLAKRLDDLAAKSSAAKPSR